MIDDLFAHSLAILAGSVIAYMAGMMWYHPKGFGTAWTTEQAHRKVPDDYQKGMKAGMALSFFDTLLFGFVACLLWLNYSIEGLILLGLAVFVGTHTANIFKGGSAKLGMIDSGFLLCQLLIFAIALNVI